MNSNPMIQTSAALLLLLGAAGSGCTLLLPPEAELVGGNGLAATGGPGDADAADGSPGDAGAADGAPGDADAAGGSPGDGVADAAGDADAALPDGDASSPLFKWSFDLGCNGWVAHNNSALSTETSSFVSPPAACRICAAPGANDNFGMFTNVPVEIPTDEVIIAEARGRAAQGSVSLTVTLYTNAQDSTTGTNQVADQYGLAATAKKTPASTTLYVRGSSAEASPCMIVDEVTLRR